MWVVKLHKLYVKDGKIGPHSFFFFVLNLYCYLAVKMEISAVKIWTLELWDVCFFADMMWLVGSCHVALKTPENTAFNSNYSLNKSWGELRKCAIFFPWNQIVTAWKEIFRPGRSRIIYLTTICTFMLPLVQWHTKKKNQLTSPSRL